jgi:ABC-type polysaccharide/polyol phosphate transport system ATPase subunit
MDQPAPNPVALRLRGLGKRYAIYPNDRSRLLELVGSRRHHVEHWALRDVDLEVPRGGALGIIGPNGAGKSTLLRVLAGISDPTEGTLEVHGRLTTLLDLGVGFHDTFTGRENIALTCNLLGLTAQQVEARLPDILRFAELGAFIDHPVRTYSTGMCLRLGFAIAVHVDAEILVIDEVLAVGDQYFQRKCLRKISECRAKGVTLVVVSHDLHAIRSLCDEVAWIEGGRIKKLGRPREVVEAYLRLEGVRSAPSLPMQPVEVTQPVREAGVVTPLHVARTRPAPASWETPAARAHESAAPVASATPAPVHDDHVTLVLAGTPTQLDPALLASLRAACAPADAAALFRTEAGAPPRELDGEIPRILGTGEVRIVAVRILDLHAQPVERLRTGDALTVAVTFRTTEPVHRPIFGVALFRDDGTYVFGPNTRWDEVLDGSYHGVYTYFAHYPGLPLLAGGYRVSVAVYDAGHVAPHAWHNQLHGFEVVSEVEDHGLVRIPHAWGMIRHHDGG